MSDRIEEIFRQVMDENCKDPLRRFAELVAADEREACAKLCEQTYDKQIVQYPKGYYVDPNKMGEYSEQTAKRCAVAIRGRTA